MLRLEINYKKEERKKTPKLQGLSWPCTDQDSMLPLQGTHAQSLVRELRSFMPHSMGKRGRKKEKPAKKKTPINTWRLNDMPLNNQWITEEIRGSKKYLEWSHMDVKVGP